MKNIFEKLINSKIVAVISLIVFLTVFIPTTQAAVLTSISDKPSRESASTASNHTIAFTTPTGVAAAGTMTLTFPAGFNIGTVDYTDMDVSWGPTTGAENELLLGSSAVTTTWGAVFSGQVLTITSATGTITAGSKVIIEIGTNATAVTTGDQQIINPTAGTYTISIAGTFTDTGQFALAIVPNDQVTMAATVNASITFTLSGNSSTFNTALSTAGPYTSTSDITLTLATNTNGGYTVYVKDVGNGTTGGLYNASAAYNIASSTATLAAGTEGYGIQASTSTGASLDTVYNKTTNDVGALQTTAQRVAYRAAATSSNDSVVIHHMAAASGSTKAGAYADTLTYVVNGNY